MEENGEPKPFPIIPFRLCALIIMTHVPSYTLSVIYQRMAVLVVGCHR